MISALALPIIFLSTVNPMKNQILILLSLFLLFPRAQAQWADQARTLFDKDLPEQIKTYPDALMTFWGGFRRYLHWPQARGEIVEKASSLFKSQRFSFYFFAHPNPKAPLYIFMPGIYGQPHKGITQNFIDTLEALEGSVIVVPNLLAQEYIQANPTYIKDVVESEVAVMQEVLDFALTKLPPQPRSIHLIAESLGSGLAVAWVAEDQRTKKQISDLLLLWPPMNLFSAMKNFDNLIDSYRKFECTTIGNLLTISQKFLFTIYPEHLTQTEQECMGQVMLVDGFLKATQKSLASYKETDPKLASLPIPTGFEHFFQNYRPEVWKLISSKDPRLSLAYSVRKFAPLLPVKIITSQNDFLNKGLEWRDFAQETGLKLGQDILVLDWGGHSGSIGSPQFSEVLKLIYP